MEARNSKIMVERVEEGYRPAGGLTPFRRELMLRVTEGDPSLGPIMYHYTHFVRCDEILQWLIQHRITGRLFADWFHFDQKGSFLGSAEWVLQKIEKRKKKREIMVSRDWVP